MKKTFKIFPLLIVIILIAFTACNAKKNTMNVSEDSGTKQMQKSTGFSTNEVAQDTTQQSKTPNSLVGRKIIKSGDIALETKKYDESIKSFEALVNSYEGFIQNSNIQGSGYSSKYNSRNATYTVRIPASKLDEFLTKIGEIGYVTNKQITGEDVTESYFDVESRLKSLKIEEERLLAIKAKANTLSELLELEKRLTEIRTQIEQLSGQLQKYDALVELSTIKVTISEVENLSSKPPENFLSKIGFVFSSSIAVLGEAVKFLILAITAILPFAVCIGIILFIVFLIIKFMKKRK